MQKTIIILPSIKLLGITARTNNAHEATPAKAKISPTLERYFQDQIPQKITHRKNPGVTYSVFTAYESDATGDYTYFLGEAVTTFQDAPTDLEQLTIPEQTYAKFTTNSGPMPQVCIAAWQEVWKMTPETLGGQRSYFADFEIYDDRALDPKNTVLDIYIGIKK
ncbi:MAG: GyrI-like domain-containing protein [Chthoniobacterales bacterium]